MHAGTRKTVIVFVSFLLCAVLVHTIVDFRTFFTDSNYLYSLGVSKNKRDSADKEFLLGSKLIINTTGCKIPRTPIIPEYFKQKWHLEQIPKCDYETVNSVLTEDQIIQLKPEYEDKDCCLHEITRVDNEDKGFNLSPCEKLTTYADVNQKEILLVKCGKSLNFDANLAVKPAVQKKLDFWKSKPKEELPPNVLLFGIDTVSRSHAFRSLPKTMNLLKKLGFADFQAYHSLAPATLNNFMGFLMGLPREEVRSGCAPNWTSPFDSCPLIWKEFSLQNYITMYIEDGSQTFNWGGQSGFQKRPTDYYLHSLFSAIKDLRKKHSPINGNEDKIDCTSSETVPQFVVRYTHRFIRKFRDVPFFSFTWLEDPFHDNQFTLGTMDDEILSIFQLLEGLPDLLERTLVIFLSDHGDRFSFFQTKSMEGFIERGLPPLFMRFPKLLRKSFPHLDNVLETNTQSLTSPFDLHHTFKHILSLNRRTKNLSANNTTTTPTPKLNFNLELPDRSSLLRPILLERNCEKLHVQPGNCVCGTSMEVDPIQNPYYLTKIMEFAERRLNKLVDSSKYSKRCARWTATVDTILSTKILKVSDNYTDNLIQFMATPGDAKFEVRVKVLHTTTNFDGCELIGDFERINSYGNQSICVDFENDSDKRMKELCMCKSTVKENPHPTK